jgi:nucleotide-binding universal stress UspA family protein
MKTRGYDMKHKRTAYLPLPTYPESLPDDAILSAAGFANTLGSDLHVTTFSVSIPQIRSPLGSLLIDVPGLVRAAEEKSRVECLRLHDLVRKAVDPSSNLEVMTREIVLGAARDAAAAEARFYEVSVVPWFRDTLAAQEMAQAVIFGSGRPTILVPPTAQVGPLDHIMIAWDASRVAARALWDALAIIPKNCRITVLTVRDEKPLSGPGLATSLVSSLEKRGYKAQQLDITLGEKTIADVLQDAAVKSGVQFLSMGGFGHSRVRDFVLGGATRGILADLRLPVLLSH